MMKGTTHQQDTAMINIYAPNNSQPNFLEQILPDGQEQINISAGIVDENNMLFHQQVIQKIKQCQVPLSFKWDQQTTAIYPAKRLEKMHSFQQCLELSLRQSIFQDSKHKTKPNLERIVFCLSMTEQKQKTKARERIENTQTHGARRAHYYQEDL